MSRILHITIVKLHFPYQNVNILNTFDTVPFAPPPRTRTAALLAPLEHPEALRRPSGEPQRPSGDPQGHQETIQEPSVRRFKANAPP